MFPPVLAEKVTGFGIKLASPCQAVKLDTDRMGDLLRVHLQDGEVIDSKAVVIATGARYRALPLERWPDFEGAGIYYAATELEARGRAGSPVTVVGGANPAGQAALYLAGRGSEVSLVVRGPDIATEMSAYLVDRLLAHPRVTVRCRSEVTRLDGGDFPEEVTITDRTADTAQAQPCWGLFCFIGAEPATSWLTGIATGDDGFIRTDVQLTGDDLGPAWDTLGRRPLPFETSIRGVFAVGDVHSGSMNGSPQPPPKAPAPSPRYTRPSPRWPSDQLAAVTERTPVTPKPPAPGHKA